jgi:hypothetical protein
VSLKKIALVYKTDKRLLKIFAKKKKKTFACQRCIEILIIINFENKREIRAESRLVKD